MTILLFNLRCLTAGNGRHIHGAHDMPLDGLGTRMMDSVAFHSMI